MLEQLLPHFKLFPLGILRGKQSGEPWYPCQYRLVKVAKELVKWCYQSWGRRLGWQAGFNLVSRDERPIGFFVEQET